MNTLSPLVIMMFGIYLLTVAVAGNADQLWIRLQVDGKGFVPWVFAVVILSILYSADSTKPFVGPLIGLSLITVALKKYPVIKDQLSKILAGGFLQTSTSTLAPLAPLSTGTNIVPFQPFVKTPNAPGDPNAQTGG